METHQQVRQAHEPQQHKWFSRRLLLIITIVAVALTISSVWIVSSLGIIPSFWATILSIIATVFGLVVSFWPLAFSSDRSASIPATTSIPPSSSPIAPDSNRYHRIVGLPPPTDPKTIQQRERAVKEVYALLTQPGRAAIVLTGLGGVGKSTLAALVSTYAEKQRLAGNGPFQAETIWLQADESVTMVDIIGNLFEGLGKPLPNFSNLSPQSQAAALFGALNTTDKPRLVVLDQFENLLDWQTGHALPNRAGVSEWIDALNSKPCRCRLLLTSRPYPQGTRDYPVSCMQEYHVEGLGEVEGIELLRKREVKATEEELRVAVTRCDGHAFALTLLASLLQKRHISLASLLQDPIYTQLWTGNIARNLLDSIYEQQLEPLQRQLLVAFPVYREPVPLDAALALLDLPPVVSKIQVESILDGLLAQHLVQASGEGRYQLHAIVASYTEHHFTEDDEQANQQAVHRAHGKAASYYMQQATSSCPPQARRSRASDVHDLIEAIWQLCQAERWQEAYAVMEREHIFVDLHRWGSNALLLELCKLLLPPDKWQPERAQLANIYHYLAEIYRALAQPELGVRYAEEALTLYKEINDRSGEGSILNSLGRIYNALWQKDRAQACYMQALEICEEREDRDGEARVLNNLGRVLSDVGKAPQARMCFEEALHTSSEVGNRNEEGRALHGLGMISAQFGAMSEAQKYYEEAVSALRSGGDRAEEGKVLSDLALSKSVSGETEEALDYYKQALTIHKEVGSRGWESMTLTSLGGLYFQKRKYNVALACFLLAEDIDEERERSLSDRRQGWLNALRTEVGENQFAALLAQIEPQSHLIVEQALYGGME